MRGRVGGQAKSSHVGEVVATRAAGHARLDVGPSGASRVGVSRPSRRAPEPRSTLQTSWACCSMLLLACCTGSGLELGRGLLHGAELAAGDAGGLLAAREVAGGGAGGPDRLPQPVERRPRAVTQSSWMSSGASSRSPASSPTVWSRASAALPARLGECVRTASRAASGRPSARAVGLLRRQCTNQPRHQQHAPGEDAAARDARSADGQPRRPRRRSSGSVLGRAAADGGERVRAGRRCRRPRAARARNTSPLARRQPAVLREPVDHVGVQHLAPQVGVVARRRTHRRRRARSSCCGSAAARGRSGRRAAPAPAASNASTSAADGGARRLRRCHSWSSSAAPSIATVSKPWPCAARTPTSRSTTSCGERLAGLVVDGVVRDDLGPPGPHLVDLARGTRRSRAAPRCPAAAGRRRRRTARAARGRTRGSAVRTSSMVISAGWPAAARAR